MTCMKRPRTYIDYRCGLHAAVKAYEAAGWIYKSFSVMISTISGDIESQKQLEFELDNNNLVCEIPTSDMRVKEILWFYKSPDSEDYLDVSNIIREITVEGSERVQLNSSAYYKWYEPWAHHTNIPAHNFHMSAQCQFPEEYGTPLVSQESIKIIHHLTDNCTSAFKLRFGVILYGIED